MLDATLTSLLIELVAGIWCKGFLIPLATGTSLPCSSPLRLNVGFPVLFQVHSFSYHD